MDDDTRPENVEVVRVQGHVEIRIDGREDLAIPFSAIHAFKLGTQLHQAATDAKRYQQAAQDQ